MKTLGKNRLLKAVEESDLCTVRKRIELYEGWVKR